jgi:hypothetical protein
LRSEKKVVATQFAVAWRNKIDYLPDPVRAGAMSPGLAGQMFLFGGPKLEFATAEGVLTVDLVDDTPRPLGQPAATPERWQFNTEMLRNLRTVDETFGKSYVIFLPWPAYRPDITRVKISARYDPDNGTTLWDTPATVSISAKAPVWDGTATGASSPHDPPFVVGGPATSGGSNRNNGGFGSNVPPPSTFGTPIPLGGGSTGSISPSLMIQPSNPFAAPGGSGPLPLAPEAPPSGLAVPAGAMPQAPSPPPGLQPIGMVIGR